MAKRAAHAADVALPEAKRASGDSDSVGEVLRVSNRTPSVKHLMFGASGLGCLYVDVTPAQAIEVFDTVVAAGITYIDTAPWYGAGLSESRVGDYFNGNRENIKFSTKCGRIIKTLAEVDRENDRVEPGYSEGFKTDAYHKNIPVATYTAAGVRESFRQSCERMHMSTIYCLRLHDAEDPERFAEATEKGGIKEMLELRKEGLIKEVSLGMNSSEYLLKYMRMYPKGTFDNILMAGSFNLMDQDGLDVLLECQRLGLKVTNVGVFASGILWGGSHYKYQDASQDIIDKAQRWKALAQKHGLSLPQVALNFAFLPDCVEMVALGCNSAAQVKANMDLCGKPVPLELWSEAKASGLIAPNVPIPT